MVLLLPSCVARDRRMLLRSQVTFSSFFSSGAFCCSKYCKGTRRRCFGLLGVERQPFARHLLLCGSVTLLRGNTLQQSVPLCECSGGRTGRTARYGKECAATPAPYSTTAVAARRFLLFQTLGNQAMEERCILRVTLWGRFSESVLYSTVRYSVLLSRCFLKRLTYVQYWQLVPTTVALRPFVVARDLFVDYNENSHLECSWGSIFRNGDEISRVFSVEESRTTVLYCTPEFRGKGWFVVQSHKP